MVNTQTLLAQAYAAFNYRDIDGALALMSENVNWPKTSEGGRAIGKEAVREYWTHQWQEVNPHVDPLEIIDRDGGMTDVRVHQMVKSLGGEILFDGEVWHTFSIAHGHIVQMDVRQSEDSNPRLDQEGRWLFARSPLESS